MKTFTFYLSCFTLAALSLAPLVGCSSGGQNVQQSVAPAEQIGSVSSIQVIALDNRSSGGGAVLGAVLGGVIGNQFGRGSGRRVATGVGVIGGAVAGNQVERNNKTANEIYRVTVNFDNGRTQQFDYQNIGDLRLGDRVRVAGSQIYQL
ncbi:glycine zipper 2TM domain-containing protein [Rheinheimera sp. 1928-s]|uniref:glycine zipper 2TM domain-containing protein n=1 Tax=Rheinheimera sp. 1928-s TaxID=3033803 RepID=UPI002629745C|nr:glycine zipper 2TM domain-containing protein [Rheinheimera sp. 1928-s]MDF3124632.1 glycine zipper 2TM domain-containing protein [Rheinheimera sp. 1928-s]